MHEPVVPTVVQVFGPTKAAVAPPAFVRLALTAVPAGAFAKLPPPVLTLTWIVSVWSVPIGLLAVWGVIWMFASTNVLTAGPLLPPVPLVVTVKVAACRADPVQLALPVTLPGVGEVKVIVHWPAASVFGPACRCTSRSGPCASRRCCWSG